MPTTRETADHSMPYLVAIALLEGGVTLDQFRRRRYLQADVRSIMAKTEVAALSRYTQSYPRWMPTRVTLTLNDGTRESAEVKRPRGYAGRPLLLEELETKARVLASPAIGDARTRRLLRTVGRWKKGDMARAIQLIRVRR